MNDLISIIIPVYKVEKYLARCIDSILKQTYSNLEIILVNDGSPDNCGNICDEYAKKDSRIKVIHKENGGVSSARNMGLKEAKGKYIGFVDSDDFIEKDMVENLYELYKDDIDLAVCGIYGIKNTNNIKKYSKEDYFKIILQYDGPQGFLWNRLYKKEIIEKYNITLDPNVHICEDLLFNVNYANNIKEISYIEKGLYHYETNEESATNSLIANRKWVSIIDAYIKIESAYKNCNEQTYDLYLTNLLWNAVRVKIEMKISNVNYEDIKKKCNDIIKKYRNQLYNSKNISFKFKVKMFIYMHFYNAIAVLKKIKRKYL